MVRRPSFIFLPSSSSNITDDTAWPIKAKFVFIDWVFVMGSGRNVHVIHFDWGGGGGGRGGGGGGGGGGGQMSNTFFESGGKSVADPEGVQGVRSNPPPELNYFIFMGNFRKNETKLRKRTPYPEILDQLLQMSSLVNYLGAQMSSYTIFHRVANVRGGKCPALKNMERCLIN